MFALLSKDWKWPLLRRAIIVNQVAILYFEGALVLLSSPDELLAFQDLSKSLMIKQTIMLASVLPDTAHPTPPLSAPYLPHQSIAVPHQVGRGRMANIVFQVFQAF